MRVAMRVAMSVERIERELQLLREGGQEAAFVNGSRDCVVYKAVPTRGAAIGLAGETDVIVPVPEGYPGSTIDLAGLPVGSPFLGRVAGGTNNQGIITTPDGRQWQLASYHPHNGGGGPAWDQMQHGFHTYFDHLLSWLAKIS